MNKRFELVPITETPTENGEYPMYIGDRRAALTFVFNGEWPTNTRGFTHYLRPVSPADEMSFAEWTQEQKWKWFPAHKRWERNEKKVYRNKFVQKTTLELHALYTASLTK